MKTILALVSALIVCVSFANGAEALNQTCPVSGKPVNPAIKSIYSKSADLCCTKCKAKFDAAPKQWLSALLTTHRGQCPLSKKSSAGVTVTYTREVAFADAASKAQFDAAPDKFIKDVR
jgi:YHS domain-containing protein